MKTQQTQMKIQKYKIRKRIFAGANGLETHFDLCEISSGFYKSLSLFKSKKQAEAAKKQLLIIAKNEKGMLYNISRDQLENYMTDVLGWDDFDGKSLAELWANLSDEQRAECVQYTF